MLPKRATDKALKRQFPNTTFRPRISKSSNELVIMWTHSNTATSSSNNWAPNHFVPLVPKEDARVASKPGQRKRPLNAKTTTITTKKRKVTG
jgi:hypothetical protein